MLCVMPTQAIQAQSLLLKAALLAPSNPKLALLTAMACRSEGLLCRQLGDLDGSIAALMRAQAAVVEAANNSGQAEWILDTAE